MFVGGTKGLEPGQEALGEARGIRLGGKSLPASALSSPWQ